MKRRQFSTFLSYLLFSLLVVSGCNSLDNRQTTSPNTTTQTTELTVSAAASLKEVLEAIKTLYLKENPNTEITYNFGSSGSLQQQIEQGAPVDVFISAAAKQMDALQKKDLIINETRKDLLKNEIVLIVPKDNTTITSFKDLASDKSKKVALGEPESVPAGKYAQEVLTSSKILDQVKPKVVYGKDVRQVLGYVATGNTDAGIVYKTDAQVSEQVKIVETASEKSHSPVVYPIAIIKSSKHSEGSKEFVNFLSGEEAKSIFKKYGFIITN